MNTFHAILIGVCIVGIVWSAVMVYRSLPRRRP